MEEVSFQFDKGYREGSPLPWGPPVDKFGFRDREGDSYFPAPLGNSGERFCNWHMLPL